MRNVLISHSLLIALQVSIDEPDTLQKALECSNAKEWQEATNSEYESLMKTKTWELTQKPNGRKTVGCKWILKVKVGENGVERFKSRLVAKGYSQKYGIDYCETSSPVVRLASLCTMLANAVKNDMFIHQMDVETAFLNGALEEEIYMEQPEGYVKPGKEYSVCKLNKSLYGLKQSPRCWNQNFVESVKSLGFKQGQADPCIFVKIDPKKLSVIGVHVDDLIIVTKSEK